MLQYGRNGCRHECCALTYAYAYTYAFSHRYSYACIHTNSYPRRYHQSGYKRCKFFCYTEWLSQPAWSNHDRLFSIWFDDRLRLHHPYADSDWQHGPTYQCCHQRLECEPRLSFSNRSPQRRGHRLWRRSDLYYA